MTRVTMNDNILILLDWGSPSFGLMSVRRITRCTVLFGGNNCTPMSAEMKNCCGGGGGGKQHKNEKKRKKRILLERKIQKE